MRMPTFFSSACFCYLGLLLSSRWSPSLSFYPHLPFCLEITRRLFIIAIRLWLLCSLPFFRMHRVSLTTIYSCYPRCRVFARRCRREIGCKTCLQVLALSAKACDTSHDCLQQLSRSDSTADSILNLVWNYSPFLDTTAGIEQSVHWRDGANT